MNPVLFCENVSVAKIGNTLCSIGSNLQKYRVLCITFSDIDELVCVMSESDPILFVPPLFKQRYSKVLQICSKQRPKRVGKRL